MRFVSIIQGINMKYNQCKIESNRIYLNFREIIHSLIKMYRSSRQSMA